MVGGSLYLAARPTEVILLPAESRAGSSTGTPASAWSTQDAASDLCLGGRCAAPRDAPNLRGSRGGPYQSSSALSTKAYLGTAGRLGEPAGPGSRWSGCLAHAQSALGPGAPRAASHLKRAAHIHRLFGRHLCPVGMPQ